jgi:hypothetical protein
MANWGGGGEAQREHNRLFRDKYYYWEHYNDPDLPADQQPTLADARVSRTHD